MGSINPDASLSDAAASNAANLDAAFDVLVRLIRARIGGSEIAPGGEIRLMLYKDASPFCEFIAARHPPFNEYIVLLLALAPHVRTQLPNKETRAAPAREGDFPEIGGIRDADSRAFLPTGETAAFLIAGDDLDGRFEVQRLFSSSHWFAHEGILRLEPPKVGAPILSGRIVMARDWVERFTTGSVEVPSFGADFPARRIATALDWDDIVLSPAVREQIDEIRTWIEHHDTLLNGWNMHRRIRPGYRALFYGPPGTGKTLTATLIGKYTGRPVFRIDLSTIVSKYIGETEKNLGNLFDRASNKDWILFFDEADALFGKRTSVKDAHDRYANQEISYLLQRLEDFDGLVILASNFKSNMDDAFVRRFNAIIRFPFPDEAERVAIWRAAMP